MPAQLAAALELGGEPRGLRFAIRLIGGVDPAAVGIRQALIEGHSDVARPHPLDQVPEEARKPEDGVRGIAVPVHHVGEQGMVCAEHIHRGVDEEDQGSSACRTCRSRAVLHSAARRPSGTVTRASAGCARAADSNAENARAGTPSGRRARGVPSERCTRHRSA